MHYNNNFKIIINIHRGILNINHYKPKINLYKVVITDHYIYNINLYLKHFNNNQKINIFILWPRY